MRECTRAVVERPCADPAAEIPDIAASEPQAVTSGPSYGTGVSPWVYAGSAQYGRRQAGWTFAFSEPPEGVTFTMRAQVEFEW